MSLAIGASSVPEKPLPRGAVKKPPRQKLQHFSAVKGLVASPTARPMALPNGFGSPLQALESTAGGFFTAPRGHGSVELLGKNDVIDGSIAGIGALLFVVYAAEAVPIPGCGARLYRHLAA